MKFLIFTNASDNDSYGESVTQLEHMVQSAQLAEQEGYDEEVVMAAFFHDIGHLYETEYTDQMGSLEHSSTIRSAAIFYGSAAFPNE